MYKEPLSALLLLRVWRHPREVVRAVVNQGGLYGVLLLAVASGAGTLRLVGSLDASWIGSLALMSVIFLPLFGLLALGVESLLVWFSAQFFARPSEGADIAVALSWGRVPLIVARIAVLPITIAVGFGVVPELLHGPAQIFSTAVVTVGWCWSCFTTAVGLSEVLGVSAWRSVLVYLAPFVLLGALLFGLGLLILLS